MSLHVDDIFTSGRPERVETIKELIKLMLKVQESIKMKDFLYTIIVFTMKNVPIYKNDHRERRKEISLWIREVYWKKFYCWENTWRSWQNSLQKKT